MRARAPRAAALALSGQNTGDIAAELGLSRSQTWRVLRSDEVQHLVITLVNSESSVLISLFRRGLKAIEEALEADRPDTITKAGVVIAAGPDHYARLAAVARLLQVLTAGRPKPKPAMIDPKRGLLSLAEVEAQVHGATEE